MSNNKVFSSNNIIGGFKDIDNKHDKRIETYPLPEYSVEKELNFLLNENKELREINLKLSEKKEELDKKIKSSNTNFDLLENIYNKEFEIEELKEKIRSLDLEIIMSSGKIEILEGVIASDLYIEEVFKSINNKNILKYFNDMATKNIDKRDELKRQNKILLEKLIILGKEHKKFKEIYKN